MIVDVQGIVCPHLLEIEEQAFDLSVHKHR